MPLFKIDVSYHQIAVFAADLQNPFSAWTDRHVAQGFALRPDSASFRIFHDGPLSVSLVACELPGDSPGATRVIRVPFEVPPDRRVEVASIASSRVTELDPGMYELTFEHGVTAGRQWCNLIFCRAESPAASAVLRADEELRPEMPLLLTAQPA